MTNGLVVIGSGPGGARAAQAYRDAGGEHAIVLVSADRRQPYQRPPLSKEVLSGDAAMQPTPVDDGENAWDTIEFRLGTTVTGLDVASGTVRTTDGDLAYAACVIATGSTPKPLESAADGADIHLLRSFDDATALVAAADSADTAVVIGSGFIGCEAAASLARRGVRVTLVTPEDGPQYQRLGGFAGGVIGGWLRELGIQLRTGRSVESVDAPRTVRLDDGSVLEPDLVLAALGVSPATDFLRSSGLELRDGLVVVDAHLRSSAPAVFACGDVALARNVAAGRRLAVEHWGDAEAMGAIAGANAAGGQQQWSDVPGFWTTIGERTLKYTAWGDGFDQIVVDQHHDGSFAVWYGKTGVTVGVLSFDDDDAYDQGMQLVKQGAALPAEGS